MIQKKKSNQPIVIDIDGPDGNAYVLMGHVKNWCKQCGIDYKPILDEMTSGDYEHLLSVIEKNFPSVVLERGYEKEDDE